LQPRIVLWLSAWVQDYLNVLTSVHHRIRRRRGWSARRIRLQEGECGCR
jgi:hypothetical protein